MTWPHSLLVPQGTIPDRADKLLAGMLDGSISRSAMSRLMKQGLVLVDGVPISASTILVPGQSVVITQPDTQPEKASIPAQAVPVLFEDHHVVVVDKPAGLVVHPGAGRASGTLMDLLVETRPAMIGVGESDRWGIVHRLDRDTSGVMVVAKTQPAHDSLSVQFREHSIRRVYLTMVRGEPRADQGVIDLPLGRHPVDRKKISTHTRKARHAVTRWKVLERLGGLTLLEIMPETGRTHQIRVHLASVGLPVAGDPVYGRRRSRPGRDCGLNRQALHAAVLGFVHPADGQFVEFSSPLPDDMSSLIAARRGQLLEVGP